MYSTFSEDGHSGIKNDTTGERWFVDDPKNIEKYIEWLNANMGEDVPVFDFPCEETSI